MKLPRTLAAAVLVAAAAFVASAAEGDLVLEAVLEQKSVKLGEDAVLVVSLTNHTATATTAPLLRLAKDSISVRVSGGGANSVVARLYGSFLPDDAGGLDFRPAASPQRKLDAGATVQARISIPAVLAGDLALTAVLADGTPTKLEAKPVTVEVQGRQHVAAQVETTRGSFRIDLDAAAAYASVANFWTLARDGTLDGLPFHRVLLGVLVQSGDPRGTGTGGPGWYLPGETAVTTSSRGDVGLARGAHADTAGSQWFVVTDPLGSVAGGYVRIGTVTEGIEFVDQLAGNPVDARTGRPKTPDRVVSVKTLVR